MKVKPKPKIVVSPYKHIATFRNAPRVIGFLGGLLGHIKIGCMQVVASPRGESEHRFWASGLGNMVWGLRFGQNPVSLNPKAI